MYVVRFVVIQLPGEHKPHTALSRASHPAATAF